MGREQRRGAWGTTSQRRFHFNLITPLSIGGNWGWENDFRKDVIICVFLSQYKGYFTLLRQRWNLMASSKKQKHKNANIFQVQTTCCPRKIFRSRLWWNISRLTLVSMCQPKCPPLPHTPNPYWLFWKQDLI